jgi:hypothetical protein
LVLADSGFTQVVQAYQQAASDALGLLAQRMGTAHLATLPPAELLRPNPNRRRFAGLLAQGLGRQWHKALGKARSGAKPQPRVPAARPHVHASTVRALLSRPEVQSALAEHLAPHLEAVASSVANLTLLGSLPFSHLVPDPRMLPAESIRFFYVDTGWLDALAAGALSLAVQGSADAAVQAAMRPALDTAVARHRAKRMRERNRGKAAAAVSEDPAAPLSGFLIRSALVSGWPGLSIMASQGGQPLPVAYRACPSPNVLLCLFQGVPDTVQLAEPYQGLQFGVADNGVAVRDVANSSTLGQQTSSTVPASGGFAAFQSTYCRDGVSVVSVQALAQALAAAVQAQFPSFDPSTFGAGDFALQLVLAPEMQTFPYPAPS